MLDEAVGPILESIRVGRTDILRTLLEEVRAEIDRGDSDRAEAGQGSHTILAAVFLCVSYCSPTLLFSLFFLLSSPLRVLSERPQAEGEVSAP